LVNKSFNLNSELRGRYEKEAKKAEKLYHDGWYGSPVKRIPSNLYRNNYDKIKWNNKEELWKNLKF